MKFEKMHGIGNDYIYVNCFEERIDEPEKAAMLLSDRHFGIGGDGLVLIMPSNTADFRMRMFNADGSEGRMCGNAIRCVAKYCREHGMTEKDCISVETLSGIKNVKLISEKGSVLGASVDMGKAVFDCSAIPCLSDEKQLIGVIKRFGTEEYTISCVSIGNPHCVIFCEDCESVELDRIGAVIENDPMFPERINVEFAQLTGENSIKMRVWERGSGITLACGTGACAVAAAAVALGLCGANREISVGLPGGTLSIVCSEDYSLTLIGPAASVFSGEIIL